MYVRYMFQVCSDVVIEGVACQGVSGIDSMDMQT